MTPFTEPSRPRAGLFALARPTLAVASAAVLALLALSACSPGSGVKDPRVGGEDVTRGSDIQLDESAIIALVDPSGVAEIAVPVERRVDASVAARAEIAIRDLSGERLGSVEQDVRLTGEDDTIRVAVGGLPSELETGDLANYVIHYSVTTDRSTLLGRRSLFAAAKKREIVLLSNDTFQVDGQSFVRVVAREPASGEPIVGATVTLALDDGEGSRREIASAETDEAGVAAIPAEVEEEDMGDHDMVVTFSHADHGIEEIVRSVRVERKERILLTTDKPLYQPGQLIHVRTLTLRRPTLLPAADDAIVIEVSDARGNKIARREMTTDEFGVAATDIRLAQELNEGSWTISATVGGTTSEKTITVGRYVLPKFGIEMTTDRSFYGPGDEVTVAIAADYFFGQPVADGAVTMSAFALLGETDTELHAVESRLDANGQAELSFELPSSLSTESFLQITVTVVDATGHEQTAARTLPVSANPIEQVIIPAADLLPGTANQFYVLTSEPTGAPIQTENTISVGSTEFSFETDEAGFAEIEIDVPADISTLELRLASQSSDGARVERPFAFAFGFSGDGGGISIRTDKALYRAGDTAEVSVLTGSNTPSAFVDLIRDGQTVLTRTVSLEEGIGRTAIDVTTDMVGSVAIHAYFVADTGAIRRADQLVYVEPANDLDLEFTPRRDEYLPGEEATIDVRVTDTESGDGAVAAVGLSIVDEAVFALQEMQPGLERLFFRLESERLTPRVDVHRWDYSDVVSGGGADDMERERAAEVLFAAVDSPGYAISVNSLSAARSRAVSIAQAQLERDAEAAMDRAMSLFESGLYDHQVFNDIELARDLVDDLGKIYDPWGQAYRIEPIDRNGWVEAFEIAGAGPDEAFGTDDDVSDEIQSWELQNSRGSDDGAVDEGDFDGPPMAGGGGGEPAPDPSDRDGETPGEDGGSDAPRVRSFFPETLWVEPALITDEEGRASLTIPVADSITTWRITGMASSRSGQLGSSTAGLRVFQDFFIDIDFPVELTQNDIVSVPIAIFNFLDEPQTVDLRVDMDESGDWFELLGDSELSVELEAGEITVRHFEVRVEDVGWNPFQVTAIGSEMSDAIRRIVRIVPDGQEVPVSISDRLTDVVEKEIEIPEEAIDNASNLIVKIYPGLFAQVIEGLDSLLQQPNGCFEQTSSSTYPNVLVLNYLQETGQSTPEVELTAMEYIAQGYQRLLSFEVDGGGFEWFGNPPSHRILTAYGLLEFSDMSRVFPVDPAVIERTQAWLLSQQESDGRFRAAAEGIHEGATNAFQDSDVRATSYITFSLLESGVDNSATSRAVSWVKSNMDDVDDAYTLAMVANMLVVADPTDPFLSTVLSDLDELKRSEETDSGTIYWWESESESLYYGGGEAMNMETTALALQALVRSGTSPSNVEGIVGYLIQNKDSFGNFASTQATILSLRSFIEILRNSAEPSSGTIRVFANGAEAASFEVTRANSDLMRQADLRDHVVEGTNRVRIEFEGEGSFLYQIAGRYYLPWSIVGPPPGEETLDLDVDYTARAEDGAPGGSIIGDDGVGSLDVGQWATVTASLQNVADERVDMVMVEVGLGAAFDAETARLAEHPKVSRVERRGRNVTIYLYGLDPEERVELPFDIVAATELEVRTPPAAAWLYYEPAVRVEDEPVALRVR